MTPGLVIAIDTSERGAVVVAGREGDQTVFAVRREGSLSTSVADLLRDHIGAGAAIDAVVVAVGPGSYTGIRAGMAAGLGIAQARGIPLHGVGSLDILAHAAPADAREIRVLADAGRGGVYVADFRRDGSGVPRAATAAWRGELGDLTPGPAVVVATTPVGTATVVDPAAALAAAIPTALASPSLDPSSLRAEQVSMPQFSQIARVPRV